jgi:hypothetical protein
MQRGLTNKHKNKTCVSWFHMSVPLKEDIKVIIIVTLQSGITAGAEQINTSQKTHSHCQRVSSLYVYI